MISANTSRDIARQARRMRLRRCAQSRRHARRQRAVVGSPGASGAVIGSAVIGPAPCSGRVAVAIAGPRKWNGPRSVGRRAKGGGRLVRAQGGVCGAPALTVPARCAPTLRCATALIQRKLMWFRVVELVSNPTETAADWAAHLTTNGGAKSRLHAFAHNIPVTHAPPTDVPGYLRLMTRLADLAAVLRDGDEPPRNRTQLALMAQAGRSVFVALNGL